MRLAYYDTGALIRLIEGGAHFRPSIEEAIGHRTLCTSIVSITECLAAPLRDKSDESLERFGALFRAPNFLMFNLGWHTARRAADIRAECKLKTPDAPHFAAAVVRQCEVFVTVDTDFNRCRDFAGGPDILIVPAV